MGSIALSRAGECTKSSSLGTWNRPIGCVANTSRHLMDLASWQNKPDWRERHHAELLLLAQFFCFP